MELLIHKPEQLKALEVFSDEKTINEILAEISARARAEQPGTATKAGREAIASLAYKVARSKTFLDDAGKSVVADQKAAIKRVDALRKKVRDELDALKAEVRKPLDEWEQAEQARQAALEERVAGITGDVPEGTTAGAAREILAQVQGIVIDDSFEDFKPQAEVAKEIAVEELTAYIERRQKEEDDAAELEQLRREKAEREAREQAEAEAKAKAEAEARAAAEAEQKAKEDAEREIREKAERQQREEQIAAEAAEKAAREEREKIEREAAEKAERERVAELAEKMRAADEAHRNEVQAAAVDALADIIGRSAAELAIQTIAEGRVPAVKIEY